jgi:hypothetical protein
MMLSIVELTEEYNPMTSPRNPEIKPTEKPTVMEIRAPYTTREKRSRPNESVPNQCALDGAWSRCATSTAYGDCRAINGAKDGDEEHHDEDHQPYDGLPVMQEFPEFQFPLFLGKLPLQLQHVFGSLAIVPHRSRNVHIRLLPLTRAESVDRRRRTADPPPD